MKRYNFLLTLLILAHINTLSSKEIVLSSEQKRISILKSVLGGFVTLEGAKLAKLSFDSSTNIFSKPVDFGVSLAYGYATLNSLFYTFKNLKQAITGKAKVDLPLSNSDASSTSQFIKGAAATYIVSAAGFRSLNNLKYGLSSNDELNAPIQPILWYSIYKLYPYAKSFLGNNIE